MTFNYFELINSINYLKIMIHYNGVRKNAPGKKGPPKNYHPHSRKLSPESYLASLPGKFPPVKLPPGKMAA